MVMNPRARSIWLVTLFFVFALFIAACGKSEPAGGRLLRLATTTSVVDSGLLGELLPAFERKTGYRVEVSAVGSGKAIGMLRETRRKESSGEFVSLSGADLLNLVGILTPGPKLGALTGNRVLYRDGVPLALLEGSNTRFLELLEPELENRARLALHGHAEPAAHLPRLRRLAQLEAAREANEKRRRRRAAA